MIVNNLIFDNRGTLSKDFCNVYLASMFVFKRLGLKTLSLEVFRKRFKIPYMDFYKKHVDIPKEEIDALYLKAINFLDKPRLFCGVVETLEFFRDKGKRMVLLSSVSQEKLEQKIESNNLKEYFIDVLGGIHDKAKGLMTLINNNRFPFKRTAYIADTTCDIEAGKEVGIKTIAVTWGFDSRKKLAKAKPNFIIDNIVEIKNIVV